MSKRAAIRIESQAWELPTFGPNTTVVLHSGQPDTSINAARNLVIVGHGWLTAEEAFDAGLAYRDALMVSLGRLRIGADFGSRATRAGLTTYMLSRLEELTGQRFANDEYGLIVYPSEQEPRMVRVGSPTLTLGVSEERFTKAWISAIERRHVLAERELLSLELFHASFFQASEDTRFLLLMMAIEALIEPQPRSEKAREHVKRLMKLTQTAETLTDREKDSLLGSLRWLLNQSIRQAGRTLIENQIGDRQYDNRTAAQFFIEAYNVRSHLVHGNRPFPTREEVGNWAANLEVLVSDLLSGELLHLEP